MQDFSFDTHIFKEGNTFVAYVPALDIFELRCNGRSAPEHP